MAAEFDAVPYSRRGDGQPCCQSRNSSERRRGQPCGHPARYRIGEEVACAAHVDQAKERNPGASAVPIYTGERQCSQPAGRRA